MRAQPQFRHVILTVAILWCGGCVSGIANVGDLENEDGPGQGAGPSKGGGRNTGGSPSFGGSNPGSGGTDPGSGGTDPNGSGGTEPGSGGTAGTGGTPPVNCSKSLLDDFESTSSWFAWKDTNSPGTLTMKREAGGKEGMGLHTTVNNVNAGLASVQLNMAALPKAKACPDYAAATGLKFWAKGSKAIRVAAMVSGILPPANGGTCTNTDACWASHGYELQLTNDWKEFALPWKEFTQNNPKVATDFDKTQIKQITFTNISDGSVEFWLDSLRFESTAIDGPNDKGDPTCTVAKYMSDDFGGWFPGHNGFYQMNSLCEAIKKYWTKFTWKFANTGNADADKREIAAFFAHVKKETVGLTAIEEHARTAAPYYGRGPLQLTHQGNYQAAGTAMGEPLATDPDILARDPVATWGASLWFWIMSKGAGTMTCHDAMTTGQGNFSETSKTVNGVLEGCGSGAATERAGHYVDFCGRIGVGTGGPTTC